MGMMFVSFVLVARRGVSALIEPLLHIMLICCFFHHVQRHVTSSWELRVHNKATAPSVGLKFYTMNGVI